ncbi:hypothetical protein [Hoeflea olei]|uniref:Uncharacterized protein n=1 Tax=Hoeflea olei TaxID=1480615 RepID=A0A1C1YU75_9HYPH|nr:hypothetical protein [Hoeflea olei]OCW57103.1 hypothetical protein AWJ14_08120 [Hoeflea olei]
MEFTIGSAVFLSALVLLAILTRIAAAHADPQILRGEFAPAMFSVLIAGGLTIGLLMMALGGSGYFGSALVETLVILGFAAVAIVAVARLVGRRSQDG